MKSRDKLEIYADILATQGPDSREAKAFLLENDGDQRFVEAAALSRTLQIALQKKRGELGLPEDPID